MKQLILFLILLSVSVSCTETIGNADRTEATINALIREDGFTQTVFTKQSTPFEDSIKTLLQAIATLDTHPGLLVKHYHYKYQEYFPETEVVIQTAYRRYSLYFNHQLTELSLWVRPVGTVTRAVLTNIVDMHVDGTVDFAVESNTAPKLLFSSEAMFGEDKRGEQYESYWCIRYKNVIDTLAAYVAVSMK